MNSYQVDFQPIETLTVWRIFLLMFENDNFKDFNSSLLINFSEKMTLNELISPIFGIEITGIQVFY